MNYPALLFIAIKLSVGNFSGDRRLFLDFVKCLEPFKIATKQMEGDECTASSVVLTIKSLKETLSDLSANLKSDLLTALINAVDDRMARYEQMDLFTIAAILDPRYKLAWADSDESFAFNKMLLMSELLKIHSNSEEEPDVISPAEKRQKVSSSSGFARFLNKRCPPKPSGAEEELTRYLDSDVISLESDPLEFWRSNQAIFPTISKLAKKYLIVVSSSSPVERVFSYCGKVFRPDRCQLSDISFGHVMNIKLNNKCFTS